MKVRVVKPGPNIVERVYCSKCGKELPVKMWNDDRGVPCVDPRVVIWNYCPMCGEKIEKEGERYVSE